MTSVWRGNEEYPARETHPVLFATIVTAVVAKANASDTLKVSGHDAPKFRPRNDFELLARSSAELVKVCGLPRFYQSNCGC